jgi:soluble lytic murein transglycosylase-like protein
MCKVLHRETENTMETRKSLAWIALSAVLLGRAAAAEPAAGELEASACAALGGSRDDRLGHKFALGRAACEAAPADAKAPATMPSARHAQQLHLYDARMPAATRETAAPAPTSAPARDTAPRSRPSAPAAKPDPALIRALRLAPAVDAVARSYDIDPLLMHAIARVESRHDPAAVSHAGARGLMQVMPATAGRFGVAAAAQLYDAPTNLEVSAAYLKTLQQRFGNDLPLVLAAYNAGEGAVERHGRRIPPYPETRSYVRQVLDAYALLRGANTAHSREAH